MKISALGKFFFILSCFNSNLFSATHHPQTFLEAIKGSKTEGAEIVSHYCASCHALKPLIEVGAPKYRQKNEWQLRIAQGFPVLFQHTIEGLNAMPPRGGCFECSDQQLRLAILELLDEEQQDILTHKDHK